MVVLQNIGKQISLLRKEKGLTQKALAEQLKTNVQWVSKIERGKKNITIKTLEKVANELDADIKVMIQPTKHTSLDA